MNYGIHANFTNLLYYILIKMITNQEIIQEDIDDFLHYMVFNLLFRIEKSCGQNKEKMEMIK